MVWIVGNVGLELVRGIAAVAGKVFEEEGRRRVEQEFERSLNDPSGTRSFTRESSQRETARLPMTQSLGSRLRCLRWRIGSILLLGKAAQRVWL
jgi:hypothetical protein